MEHGRRAKTLAVAFLKFGTWMPGVARIEPNKTRWTWDDSEDTWKRAGGHFELYFGRVGKASMEVQTALLTLDPALAAAKKAGRGELLVFNGKTLREREKGRGKGKKEGQQEQEPELKKKKGKGKKGKDKGKGQKGGGKTKGNGKKGKGKGGKGKRGSDWK